MNTDCAPVQLGCLQSSSGMITKGDIIDIDKASIQPQVLFKAKTFVIEHAKLASSQICANHSDKKQLAVTFLLCYHLHHYYYLALCKAMFILQFNV